MTERASLYRDTRGGSHYILYLGLVALASFVVLPSAFQLEDTIDQTLDTSTTRFDKPGKYVGGDIFHNNEGPPALVQSNLAPGGSTDDGATRCSGATCANCETTVCCSPGDAGCCADGAGGAKAAPGILTGHYGNDICASCEGSWEVKVGVGPLEGMAGKIAGHAFACGSASASASLKDMLDKLRGKEPDKGGKGVGKSGTYSRCPTFPGAEELDEGCLSKAFGDQQAAKICWGEAKVSSTNCTGGVCRGTEIGTRPAGTLIIYDTSMGGGRVEYDLNNLCGPPTRRVTQGCDSLRSAGIGKPECDDKRKILEDCANGKYNGGTPLPLDDAIILECARGVAPLLFEERASLEECATRPDHADQTGCAYYASCREQAKTMTLRQLRDFCIQRRGAADSTCKTLLDPQASNRAKTRAYDNVKQEWAAACVGFYDDLDQPNGVFDGTTGGHPGGIGVDGDNRPKDTGGFELPEASVGANCCFIFPQ